MICKRKMRRLKGLENLIINKCAVFTLFMMVIINEADKLVILIIRV
jgi:hypothetical protein